MSSGRRKCHKCKAECPNADFSLLPDESRRLYTWCDDCRLHNKTARCYVVLLDDGVGKRLNPRFPCVYVGQSSLPPEDRFAQHRAGIKKGKGFVFKHGERLMFRLFRNLPTYSTKAEVLAAEAALADKLRAKGYTVFGGH